jgi:hypothetical protein
MAADGRLSPLQYYFYGSSYYINSDVFAILRTRHTGAQMEAGESSRYPLAYWGADHNRRKGLDETMRVTRADCLEPHIAKATGDSIVILKSQRTPKFRGTKQ